MNTKKTAASKAVKAAACVNEPSSSVALPSMKQAMLMSLTYVQQSIESLMRTRLNDEEWNECDVDVDYSVRLALECIESLRQELPDDRAIFDDQWFTAASIINLCARTFSRTDCLFFRLLTCLQKQFEVLVSVVEFADWEDQHA